MEEICLILIKTNVTNEQHQLWKICDFELIQHHTLTSWQEVSRQINKNINEWQQKQQSAKIVCQQKQWTAILDTELLLWTNETALCQLSAQYQCDVFSFVLQGLSAIYGFGFYQQNQKKRSFLCRDGQIIENNGQALAIEKSLNINQNIFDDDIFQLTQRLDFEIEALSQNNRFFLNILKNK